MSLQVKRADLWAMFESGDKPTQAQFKAFIDAMPMIYNEIVTLAVGNNTITHGNNELARIVQVRDSTGKSLDITWKIVSGSTTSVLINSAAVYTDAVVSILTAPF